MIACCSVGMSTAVWRVWGGCWVLSRRMNGWSECVCSLRMSAVIILLLAWVVGWACWQAALLGNCCTTGGWVGACGFRWVYVWFECVCSVWMSTVITLLFGGGGGMGVRVLAGGAAHACVLSTRMQLCVRLGSCCTIGGCEHFVWN
jgi:hypothetical protein